MLTNPTTMKKQIIILAIILFGFSFAKSQCVPNCGAYTVNPSTYSLFPTGGTDIVSSLSPNLDDGYASNVPIGFSFNYYCTTYSTVAICSNGFIVFGTVPSIAGADPAQTFPSTTSPNGLIAFNMCDLDPSAGGSITYTTIGTSPNQRFIVTYSNVPYWYATPPSATLTCSGQIVLYEGSNMIEIHTATVGSQSYASSQGIENQGGTAGLNVTGRTATFWSGSNSAYAFTNLIQGTPPTGVSGASAVCFGSTTNFTCAAMPGATSYSWNLPGGWSGTSTTTAITATVGVGGAVSVTATYSCGTSAAGQFTIAVNPAPIISINSVSPSVLCSGNIVTINASGGFNYTVFPGNLVVSSPFTVMPMTNTTYSLYGDDSNGCISINPGIAPVNVNATPTVVVNSGSICLGQTFTMNPVGAINYSYSSLFTTTTPTASGTYSYMVWGIASNGCVGTAVSSLTVAPLPTILATATRTQLCTKESVTLTAVGASTYSWTNYANTATIAITPTVSNPAQIFSVTGTSSLGCSKTSTISLRVNSCNSLEEVNGSENVKVFPNPFKSIIHLNFDNNSNKSFSIYDLTGALIFNQNTTDNHVDVDLTGFAAGVYYLKINSSNTTHKLIKLD